MISSSFLLHRFSQVEATTNTLQDTFRHELLHCVGRLDFGPSYAAKFIEVLR